MRLAQVGLGSGGGPSGSTVFLPAFLARSASKLPRHECQMNTATSDPRGDRRRPFTKKPLCCNQQGKNTEPKYCYEHRLPQARCLVALVPLPPACCSRGQVKSYFANSSPKIATRSPSVNRLYPAEIAQRLLPHFSAACGRVGEQCVAMTQSV